MRQRILGLNSDEVDIVDDEGSIDEKHDIVGDEVSVGVLVIEDVAIERYDVVVGIGVVGMVDDKGEIIVGEKHDIVGEHGVGNGEEVDMEVLEVDIEVLELDDGAFSVKLHMRRIPSIGCSANELNPPTVGPEPHQFQSCPHPFQSPALNS